MCLGVKVKDEMIAIAARRDELTRTLELTAAPPPLVHPNMANLWRQQFAELRDGVLALLALLADRCEGESCGDAVSRHSDED